MSKVAAIQLEFFRARSVANMEARLAAAIQPAVEQGAQLVVLPQHMGLSLLGAAGVGDDPLPVLKKKGAALLKAFEETCAGLAARFSVWLAPGSIVGAEGESLVAQAYLFAPDGRVIGRQRQTHLGAREKAWGVAIASTCSRRRWATLVSSSAKTRATQRSPGFWRCKARTS
jgi:predicted amidohydrolase